MESSNTINILNSMRGGTSSSTSGGQQLGHHQPQQRLDLPPGFRFHPTDEELVLHYLKNKVSSRPLPVPIIAEIDLYKYDPWDLPDRAICGENEWYFFTPRDRKYPNGARPNRAAGSGYWKATGTDKPISSSATSIGGGTFQHEQHQQHIKLGVKKALVFYKGRPPKGVKTNWIMHEYRLAPDPSSTKPPSFSTRRSLRLDDWVLCRIYKKMSQASRAHNGSESNSCVEEVLANLPDDHMQSDEVDASIHMYNHTRQLPRFGSLGKLIMGSMSDPFLDNVVTNQVSTLVNPIGAPNHTLNIEHLNESQATWTNLAAHIDSSNLSSSINSSNSLFPRVDGEQAHRRSTLPNNNLNVDHQNMVLNIGLASIFSSMPQQHQQHHQQQANHCDDATTSGGEVSDNTNLRWPFSDTRPKFPYV